MLTINKHDFERREIEVRALAQDENKAMIIEGYAIKFNSPATHSIGERKFTETIMPEALNNTDMKDVPLRYNHNDNVVIMARTRNKSLVLTVDGIGLKITATLIDTQQNRDLFKSIQEGLIDKMSFAFRVAKDGQKWEFTDTEDKRTITNIEKLYDVSVVDTPFYDDTEIYSRSLELLESEKRSLAECK